MVSFIVYSFCSLTIACGLFLVLYTLLSHPLPRAVSPRIAHEDDDPLAPEVPFPPVDSQPEMMLELDFAQTKKEQEPPSPGPGEITLEEKNLQGEGPALLSEPVSGLNPDVPQDEHLPLNPSTPGRSEMTALDWLVNDHVGSVSKERQEKPPHG